MNEIQQANPCSSSQAINSPNFQEFLSDLLKYFFSNLKGDLRNDLTKITGNMKVQVKQGINRYVSKQLIPELSTFIESKCGIAPEKQLLSLKPFIMKGLETFLHEGRILNKDEIITLARKSIPELITETAVPNASENTKKRVQKVVTTATNTAFDKGMTTDVITNTLPVAATEILIPEESEITKKRVQNILKSIQEIVFNSGSPPSAEKLFHTLLEKCGNEAFCLARDKLMETINDLIEMFPDEADKIMEFLMKHVLPALSVCFEATAFGLLTVFLKESFERFRKEGTVRGRNLAKPLLMKSAACAMKAANSNMLDKGIGQVSTAVTKKVVTKKVTKKVLEKSVVKNVGGEAFVQTTKRVAVKTSKNVATKVTKDVGSKAVSTAGGVTAKQSVKASTRAFKSVSVKATPGGVKVVAKTAKKTSATVTKSLSDGVGNGVKEVQKATLMKSAKTTLTETAEGVTATTTKKVTQKVTQKSVSKTTTQTTSKAAAEVGMKNAAKAGVTAAGISAIVGGVFLYNDLKELDKKKNEGTLTLTEYEEQKAERIGEFAGDVIGSGVVGTAVSIAALTGPAGWAAIGVGALVSFATGKLGGYIAKSVIA